MVITDHKPLTHLFTQPELNKRQVRWLESLTDTPINIVYRPGKSAVVPDCLSRWQPASENLQNAATSSEQNTILVEPSFLTRLASQQQNTQDPEMVRLMG